MGRGASVQCQFSGGGGGGGVLVTFLIAVTVYLTKRNFKTQKLRAWLTVWGCSQIIAARY